MGSVQNAHHLHIHRMSISCFGPLTKIWRFQDLDLCKMLFKRQWIYYMKPLLLGKASKLSLLSLTRGFLPHQHCKNKHFLTTNAQTMRILFLQQII